MKKLLFVLIVFTSCNTSNIKEVTEKEDVPVWIVKSLSDTTLKLDVTLLESETKIYIVKQINNKKEIVKVVQKESLDGVTFWVGFLIALIISSIFYAIFSNNF